MGRIMPYGVRRLCRRFWDCNRTKEFTLGDNAYTVKAGAERPHSKGRKWPGKIARCARERVGSWCREKAARGGRGPWLASAAWKRAPKKLWSGRVCRNATSIAISKAT